MGFKFKSTLDTNNKTKGVNTCEYIILHHTATKEGSLNGVLNTLTKGNVSCHFVVDTNGECYKIGDPKDILWHAGVSSWGNKKDMNKYSLGIEFIGPLSDGGFTSLQKTMGKWLIQHLMAVFNIPKENVLRHKDIAPGRKTDIADTYWNKEFNTFKDFTDTLLPRKWD